MLGRLGGYFGSRIERKLALLLSLVSLLSLVVLGVLAVRTVTVTRERNVGELEWQLVNQSVDRLRKFIDDKIESFRIVVADPNVAALGAEQQNYILQGHLLGDRSLMEVSFVDPEKGSEMSRLVRGLGQKQLFTEDSNGTNVVCLAQNTAFTVGGTVLITNGSEPFLRSVVSIQGNCPVGQALTLDNFVPAGVYTAQEAWVIQYPERREFGLSDPAIATALKHENYFGKVRFVDGIPRITLASPILNQQGNLIAILRGEATLESVGPLVAQANVGDTGFLYVTDQAGRLLAASGNFPSAKRQLGTTATSTSYVNEVLSGKVSAVSTVAQLYTSPLTGLSSYAVGRGIPRFGWGVVVEWPRAEALSIVPSVLLQLAWGALMLLLVLVVLSIFLARRFARPLVQLKQASASVGQGKFDVILPAGVHDEVGDLARGFVEMIQGLKELERIKDEFVFIAAHELRTPVTAIRGYAEMLGDVGKTFPAQAQEFIKMLQLSGARLASLVNDLLEVARSQAGRMKIQTSPQDMLAIIQATLNELAPLVREKQHTVAFAPPKTLPQVLADKDKLQEVLVNLIGNAIKYTPAGGTVEVRVEQQDATVVVAVIDDGIGIALEDQAKLFQRFFRVESEETKNIQGTGLGLFIVRQLVEHMDGKIWVQSEKGHGATFFFSLPIAGSKP